MMPNEMRRPCVITHPVVVNDGKPFDALDLNSEAFDTIRSDDAYFMYFLNEKIGVVDTYYDASLVYRNIMWQLAKAMNPPIKVTQAVLDAMGKVPKAKFLVCDDETKYLLEWDGVWKYESKDDSWTNGYDSFGGYGGIPSLSKLQINDYIQADCPLALQVLLEFNIEGETHA